jgi:hypothetical protein
VRTTLDKKKQQTTTTTTTTTTAGAATTNTKSKKLDRKQIQKKKREFEVPMRTGQAKSKRTGRQWERWVWRKGED